MRNAAPQKSMNARMHAEVLHAQLDGEAAKRRQVFLFLDAVQRAQDYRELVRMNGPECASRQIFRLSVYNHFSRKAAA